MSQYVRRPNHLRSWPVDPAKYPLTGPTTGPVYVPAAKPSRRKAVILWAAFVVYVVVISWGIAAAMGAEHFTQ